MLKIFRICGYHRPTVWNHCMVIDQVNRVFESMLSTVFVLFGDRAMHIKLKLAITIR